jgi:hypothetical protein
MLKKEYPHLTDADLNISMSDKVKNDTERRIQRAAAEARGELWLPGMGVHGGNVGGDQENLVMPRGMGHPPRGMPIGFHARQGGFPEVRRMGPLAHPGRDPNYDWFEDEDEFNEGDNRFGGNNDFAGFGRGRILPQMRMPQHEYEHQYQHQQQGRHPFVGYPARPQQPQGRWQRPHDQLPQQQAQPIQPWRVQQRNQQQARANVFLGRKNQQPNAFQGRNNPQPNVFIGRGPAANQAGIAAAQRQETATGRAHIVVPNTPQIEPWQPAIFAGPSRTQGGDQNNGRGNARNNANMFIGRRFRQ